jgi:hypothetical protein
MGKGTLEKFTLTTIAKAMSGSGAAKAREDLSELVGAAVDVSGTVQKLVKRDGRCKLVIERATFPALLFLPIVYPTQKQ